MAAFREAAGLRQQELAHLICYSRSTVANVEIGRQNAPRTLWCRADEVLHTGGVLAAGYDALRTADRQRRETTARRRRWRSYGLKNTTSNAPPIPPHLRLGCSPRTPSSAGSRAAPSSAPERWEAAASSRQRATRVSRSGSMRVSSAGSFSGRWRQPSSTPPLTSTSRSLPAAGTSIPSCWPPHRHCPAPRAARRRWSTWTAPCGCRVSADNNPLFAQLLQEFAALTGVPVVLNTSFNDADEPIVGSPGDAVRTYHESRLDALVIGPYVVRNLREVGIPGRPSV
ncbi:MAG: helix-turn-helix domain-containing protein [Dactylosporangium sp.]|nr:helix-turn-helix domain-containing protein [Dactylosporangium sp.]